MHDDDISDVKNAFSFVLNSFASEDKEFNFSAAKVNLLKLFLTSNIC